MCIQITAANIVHAIGRLSRDRRFNYINARTPTTVRILDVTYPEGPIRIERQVGINTATQTTMSTEMIWRVANACRPGIPLMIDRILGASYNTRSALETLMAHTSEFYFCYPGRIEIINSSSEIRRGHKHILWLPDQPHEFGQLAQMGTDLVISEVPGTETVYEALTLPENALTVNELDIEIRRRHAQIQVALIMIGRQLGYRTWIAQGDQGITYQNQRIVELEGVIPTLAHERMIGAFDGATQAATHIDCIWFRNGRLMPAVMEIEHSTRVTSGLTRMKGLQDRIPALQTRYVIVASDEDREMVLREANREQFRSLNTRYFPYSAVEELYSLCQRRRIHGIDDSFLECFMEPTLQAM